MFKKVSIAILIGLGLAILASCVFPVQSIVDPTQTATVLKHRGGNRPSGPTELMENVLIYEGESIRKPGLLTLTYVVTTGPIATNTTITTLLSEGIEIVGGSIPTQATLYRFIPHTETVVLRIPPLQEEGRILVYASYVGDPFPNGKGRLQFGRDARLYVRPTANGLIELSYDPYFGATPTKRIWPTRPIPVGTRTIPKELPPLTPLPTRTAGGLIKEAPTGDTPYLAKP